MTLLQKAKKAKIKANEKPRAGKRAPFTDDEVNVIAHFLNRDATWQFIANWLTKHGPTPRTEKTLSVTFSKTRFNGRLAA